MQDIHYHKESFFYSRFFIGFLVIIFGIFTYSIIKVHKKYTHAKSIRDDFRAELVEIEQQHTKLQKNIENLSTERGLEAEIRDRYRVVKEGEQMILIIDNNIEKINPDSEIALKGSTRAITTFIEKVKSFMGK